MNRYETIARNAYTDTTTLDDGTTLGLLPYIDFMRGDRDLVTYYASVLSAMSGTWKDADMWRALKPKLAALVYAHCQEKLREPPFPVKNAPVVYSHFSELLRIPSDMPLCLDTLRTVKPKSVIDQHNNYVLGPREKSVFATWIKSLRESGYLKESATYKVMARLLPTIIKNISVAEKTLRSESGRAFDAYSAAINDRVNKIFDLPIVRNGR